MQHRTSVAFLIVITIGCGIVATKLVYGGLSASAQGSAPPSSAVDVFIKNWEAPGTVGVLPNGEKYLNIGVVNGGDTIPIRFDANKLKELRENGGLPISLVQRKEVFQYRIVSLGESELNGAGGDGYDVVLQINQNRVLMRRRN